MASSVSKAASLTAARNRNKKRDIPRKLSEQLGDSMDAIEMDAFDMPTSLPPEEQWLKHGTVQKRTLDHNAIWQERRLIVTRNALFFARPREFESDLLLDALWLHEISSVEVPYSSSEEQNADASAQRESNGAGMGNYGILEESQASIGAVKSHGAAKPPEYNFDIYTNSAAHGRRCYCLRCGSAEEQAKWVRQLQAVCGRAREEHELSHLDHNRYWRQYGLRDAVLTCEWYSVARFRARLKRWYESNATQYGVACVIMLAFLTHIFAVERVPEPHSQEDTMFKWMDHAFTLVFALELAINLTSNWCLPFFRDRWNLFDAWVVLVSLATTFVEDITGANLLRLFRVFRVLRLFKRLVALRSIINALIHSIIPVANSFVVLVLVTCIYAVIAVDLFKLRAPDLFGNFSLSLFTMFQVCTGDGWAISVARPLSLQDDGDHSRWVFLFFVSYVLIVGTVLINVVVAVILDEFISAVALEKDAKAQQHLRAHQQRHAGCLDPLLLSLARSHSVPEFNKQVRMLHAALDTGMQGVVSQEELRHGLSRLTLEQGLTGLERVHLSVEDCEVLTENGALCDASGGLTIAAFEHMISAQLSAYVQRRLELAMEEGEGSELSTVLFALKLVTMPGTGPSPATAPPPATAAHPATHLAFQGPLECGAAALGAQGAGLKCVQCGWVHQCGAAQQSERASGEGGGGMLQARQRRQGLGARGSVSEGRGRRCWRWGGGWRR